MRISESTENGVDFLRCGSDSAPTDIAPVRLPALVKFAIRDSDPPPRTRPLCALIAQLVAGAENLPSARLRRRADPAESAGHYRAIARLAPEAPTTPRRVI
jgi:hypothetical protein